MDDPQTATVLTCSCPRTTTVPIATCAVHGTKRWLATGGFTGWPSRDPLPATAPAPGLLVFVHPDSGRLCTQATDDQGADDQPADRWLYASQQECYRQHDAATLATQTSPEGPGTDPRVEEPATAAGIADHAPVGLPSSGEDHLTPAAHSDVDRVLSGLRERLFGLEARANTLGEDQAIRGDDAQVVWSEIENAVRTLAAVAAGTQDTLRDLIHETARLAINSVYGTDDRHAYMGLRVAQAVIDGRPLPWRWEDPALSTGPEGDHR